MPKSIMIQPNVTYRWNANDTRLDSVVIDIGRIGALLMFNTHVVLH